MEISKLKKCSRRLLVAAGKLFCLMHFVEISMPPKNNYVKKLPGE